MFEIMYHYGSTQGGPHHTIITVDYKDKHGEPIQIKQIRWLTCVKIGLLIVYELIDFPRSQTSSTEFS